VINLLHLSIYLTPSLYHHMPIRPMPVRWVHIGLPQRQNSFTRDSKGRCPTLCSNAATPRGLSGTSHPLVHLGGVSKGVGQALPGFTLCGHPILVHCSSKFTTQDQLGDVHREHKSKAWTSATPIPATVHIVASRAALLPREETSESRNTRGGAKSER
jgi:hypothetical protein